MNPKRHFTYAQAVFSHAAATRESPYSGDWVIIQYRKGIQAIPVYEWMDLVEDGTKILTRTIPRNEYTSYRLSGLGKLSASVMSSEETKRYLKDHDNEVLK